MTTITLKPEPLTREAFAPFGDVIEVAGSTPFDINAGTIERFDALAEIELDDDPAARASISLGICRVATKLPMTIRFVERHPLGSQAFVPLDTAPLIPVVAPPGDRVDPQTLQAFVTDGSQGIHYRRGTWHLPLICLAAGQRLVIVDRRGPGANCDEFHFDETDIRLVL